MVGRNYCGISGCHTNKKKKKCKRVTLFSIPRNPEDQEKWSKAIQRTDKPMRLGDKVCELHFTKDDIVRFYETVLPDGTVWRMKRGISTLKKGAVPTIFPNVKNAPQKRKSETALNNADKKPRTYCKKSSECAEIVSDELPSHLITTSVKIECPEYTETVESSQQTEIVLNNMNEPFSYSTLVNNLEQLLKPDLLWGISIHDEFVVCAKWNKEGILMKSVIVDCNLKIKVFFKNKAIETDYVKINNMTALSTLIKNIDRCGVCINVNDIEKSNCDGYVLPGSQSNLCSYCLLIGNWEINRSKLKNLFWLSKGQNFIKLQTLYDKIRTLNKNNMMLKKQLHKIFKIKAAWKMPEQANQNPTER